MYKVYLISDKGDGMVTALEDWDGDNSLTLHLSAFASDAVIEIVRHDEPEKDKDE